MKYLFDFSKTIIRLQVKPTFSVELKFILPYVRVGTAHIVQLDFCTSYNKKGLCNIGIPFFDLQVCWGEIFAERIQLEEQTKQESNYVTY